MANLTTDQLSILLVEPSDVQRKVILRHLEEEGITHVESAGSIEEAKAKLPSFQPDLVTSAMYFADGEAMDLLHFIGEHPALEQTLFMLVSSEHKREHLELFKQAGCIAILPKPFTSKDLQTAINATLDLIAPEDFNLDHFDVEDLRVLLVDDSNLSRHYLRRVFESIGVSSIVEAANGKEGVSAAEHNDFDLICTDYHMPEMDGRELAEAVRNQPGHEHIPILMVSARADELQLTQIEQAGVNALTDKPFAPEILRRTLKQLLDNE
ncbi:MULTISPECIES: response regulator [Gammaproteobacteria]|uniref:response regulator n=1 Tax=Gammaproteobacteria TaxID=1236 RepID=UPI000DD07AFC|nr:MULTISPECIES: response regulator [Gammaproteobacteria]RTE87540.1 response regulator [Aliidiomarina sp. B3213]TCZ92675.1 response regulator [Lysobacter sp. N42]